MIEKSPKRRGLVAAALGFAAIPVVLSAIFRFPAVVSVPAAMAPLVVLYFFRSDLRGVWTGFQVPTPGRFRFLRSGKFALAGAACLFAGLAWIVVMAPIASFDAAGALLVIVPGAAIGSIGVIALHVWLAALIFWS
jgi:hypothetical protein